MARVLDYVKIEIVIQGAEKSAKISFAGKDEKDYSKGGSQDFPLNDSRTEADMIAEAQKLAETTLDIDK